MVLAGDHAVVIAELFFGVFGGARHGGEFFVAAVHVAIVEGMFWEPIFRQRHLGRVVHFVIRRRRRARIMRAGEGEIADEGLVPFLLLKKIDGGIGVEMRGELVDGFLVVFAVMAIGLIVVMVPQFVLVNSSRP